MGGVGHATKGDVTLPNAKFKIAKAPAESGLSFDKIASPFKKPWLAGGKFSEADILSNIKGDASKYKVKSISIVSGDAAQVNGKNLDFKKAGKFIVKIVLEHPFKGDVILSGAEFEIEKGSAPTDLGFPKLVKDFDIEDSRVISFTEVLDNVTGSKTGYTIKEIKNISDSSIATVSGKEIKITKFNADFTADLVLEHLGKKNVTLIGASFSTTLYALGFFYKGEEPGYGKCLAQTSDGGFALAGASNNARSYSRNMFLVKADKDGNKKWDKTYGLTNLLDVAEAMVQTSDGGFALAGIKDKSAAGAAWNSMSLVLTDDKGNQKWSKTYRADGGDGLSPSSDQAYGIVQTADKGFVLVGKGTGAGGSGNDALLVKVDKDGNKEWHKKYDFNSGTDYAYSLVQTADGGFAFAGYATTVGASADMWLVKVDKDGDKEWQKTYGSAKAEIAYSLVQTADGGFALAGYTMRADSVSGSDALLVKVDKDGNKEWEKTYGGNRYEYANALLQTADGGYAIAGSSSSHKPGYGSMWLLLVDKNGKVKP